MLGFFFNPQYKNFFLLFFQYNTKSFITLIADFVMNVEKLEFFVILEEELHKMQKLTIAHAH